MKKFLSVDGSTLTGSSGAAKVLGVTPPAVLYLARTGQLPATTTAHGTKLFDLRDVQALKRKRETK